MDSNKSSKKPFKVEIVWRNIALMTILHISALYGLYLYAAVAQIKTIIAVVLFKVLSGEFYLLMLDNCDAVQYFSYGLIDLSLNNIKIEIF